MNVANENKIREIIKTTGATGAVASEIYVAIADIVSDERADAYQDGVYTGQTSRDN